MKSPMSLLIGDFLFAVGPTAKQAKDQSITIVAPFDKEQLAKSKA